MIRLYDELWLFVTFASDHTFDAIEGAIAFEDHGKFELEVLGLHRFERQLEVQSRVAIDRDLLDP